MHALLKISAAAVAILAVASFGATAAEKVTFGTNWLAQAEHGGYYQAVADGTYTACGLDVTIMQGGPQVSGRPLLLAGKIDFYMGGNLLQAFDAVKENIPLRVVAASFQKEPQVSCPIRARDSTNGKTSRTPTSTFWATRARRASSSG